jgi:BolA family transcriptional regulator, general stress-responsive regulator
MQSGSSTRSERIRALLEAGLSEPQVQVVDESHLHIGHAGARDGRGHFRAHIVSSSFTGLRPLQRHQLVYRILNEMMQTEIHALNIVALTPEEAKASNLQRA